HPHGGVPEAFDRAALARLAVEALLDQARIELHDLLDRHRDFVVSQLAAEWLAVDHGLLEQSGAQADAFADDRDVGVDVVTSPGAGADDASVLDDEAIHDGLWDDHRAGLFGLLRKPGVELRAQHRIGMRMRSVA